MRFFCCLLIRNNWLYFCSRVQSSPSHLSVQKLILSPHPTFQAIFWWKMLWSDWWYSFLRSLHQWEYPPLSRPFWNSDQPPYLEVIILAHNCCWSETKAHIHLPSKATLNLEISLIPRPPSILGRKITSHFTQGIFLCSWSPPHKKFLCKDTNLWATLWGILKKDKR